MSKGYFQIALMLGWQDVKQAYRRSALGPFWITISMAIQILTIGIVFGIIFKAELDSYLPFVATSTILWNYFYSLLVDSAQSFIYSEPIIKQYKLPHTIYLARAAWKNIIILGHNLVLLPIIFVYFTKLPKLEIVYLIPGLLLTSLVLFQLGRLLALISVRYRDVPLIIQSTLNVVYFVTPVMWYPDLINNNSLAHFLLGLNPFYHLLQIVRLPLLGESPTMENWLLSAGMLLVTSAATHKIYKKFESKIAYWV